MLHREAPSEICSFSCVFCLLLSSNHCCHPGGRGTSRAKTHSRRLTTDDLRAEPHRQVLQQAHQRNPWSLHLPRVRQVSLSGLKRRRAPKSPLSHPSSASQLTPPNHPRPLYRRPQTPREPQARWNPNAFRRQGPIHGRGLHRKPLRQAQRFGQRTAEAGRCKLRRQSGRSWP